MESLENKVIVYDDACPMCEAYTAGFEKLGWLKRTGFTTASPELLARLNLDRARHEIPLLDTVTGEVHYGLDALFLILGQKMPVFKPLFRSKWFRAPVYQLYQLITYNRRIIAGSKSPDTGFDCAPDVNPFYRWCYIAGAVAMGAWLVYPKILQANGAVILLLAVLGSGFLAILFTTKKLDFAGHWATVFLINGLLATILPTHAATFFGLGLLSLWMGWKRWALLQDE
jgi:hypothetical protein